MNKGLDALGKGRVSPVAEQRAQVVRALEQAGEKLSGTRGGPALCERGAQVVEVAGGQPSERGPELCERLALDCVHEVGDVTEVGVERAARDSGALGHGGDGHAGEVAGGADLLGEGPPERTAGADAAAVRAGREGHDARLGPLVALLAQCLLHAVPSSVFHSLSSIAQAVQKPGTARRGTTSTRATWEVARDRK